MENIKDLEWTMLWMSIRYAMNRQTIASVTLPTDIIKEYYHKLSDGQRKMIVRDLKDNIEEAERLDFKAFGSENIDRPVWLKFLACLDNENHYQIEAIDGSIHTVFEANGRIYPLERYVEYPHKEIDIPKENIKRIL